MAMSPLLFFSESPSSTVQRIAIKRRTAFPAQYLSFKDNLFIENALNNISALV